MKDGFSRRAFVGGAPGAIAAAPIMAKQAASAIGRIAGGLGTDIADTAKYAGETAQSVCVEKSRMSEIYDNPAVQALRKQVNRHNNRNYRRNTRRSLCGGFDPDIAYLRSPSMSARLRMQEARDRLAQREGATLGNMVEDKIAELASGLGINVGNRLRQAVDSDEDDFF
jgi:hypothetical protein